MFYICRRFNSVVGISFLAELPALGGRKRLPDGIVSAIIAF
jgi:hypothetical protein